MSCEICSFNREDINFINTQSLSFKILITFTLILFAIITITKLVVIYVLYERYF